MGASSKAPGLGLEGRRRAGRGFCAGRGGFFRPDTAVATPDESHAGRTRPWQDQTLLMRESHGRGWAA